MKLALSVLVIRALLAVPVGTAIKKPVKVTVGLVAGVPGKDPSVSVFEGIPFAAPPVGGFRWGAIHLLREIPDPPGPLRRIPMFVGSFQLETFPAIDNS
jgi:hypothetical protein